MRSTFLSCVLVLALAASAHSKLLTADLIRDSQPLLPYFTWLMDPEGKETITSITAGSAQERLAPLANGIPLKGQGPVWLRLTVIKIPPSPASNLPRMERPRLLVNLGELPPGGTRMFLSESPGPVASQGVWHSETVAPHSDVVLPEPGLLPMSIYFRMDSMPGLWFAPTVSLQGAQRPDLLPSELLLPGLLTAACAACLLRAIANRAQWALWAALFLACGLAQSVLPLPALNRGFTLHDLPALLAPGMALVLLPHVGRCMLRTNSASSLQDAVLYFCSILGVAVCLVPLIPGMSWLARLFPLWPLLLLPLLPVCVSALAGKKPGALPFASVCVMSFVGACLAFYAIDMPAPHPLAAQGSLWGLAVGGLGLALARIPRELTPEQAKEGENAQGLDLAGTTLSGTGSQAHAQSAEPAGSAASPPSAQFGSLPSFEDLNAAEPSTLSMDISQLKSQTSEEEAASEPLTLSDEVAKTADAEPWGMGESAGEVNIGETSAPAGGQSSADDASMSWNPEDPAYPYMSGGLTFGSFTTIPPPSPSTARAGESPADDSPEGTRTEATGASAPVETPWESGSHEEIPAFPQTSTGTDATEGARQEAHQEAAPGAEEEARPAGPAAPDREKPELPVPAYQSRVLPDFTATSDASSVPMSEEKLISLVAEDFSSYSHPLLEDLQEESARHTTLTSSGAFLFNLHSLVREVHDIVLPVAKNKGLLFSWYITPSLPVLLEGDAPRLRGALSLLLQNAVQATHQGAVQLAVRRNPGGGPGDLLFSISDSGSAQRTDAGFFHAWELAARTGGVFNVEYSPGSGTQITFTAHFALPSEEAARKHASGLAKPVRWDEIPSLDGEHAFLHTDQEQVDFSAVAQTETQGPAGRDPVNEYDAAPELDDNYPVSVLWNKSSLPPDGLLSPFAPEDPEMAALTPEQVLEQQAFLEPLPETPLSDSLSAPFKTGFRSQADLDQPGAAPLIVAAEMTNSKRKLLSHYLGDLPHEHIDAANNSQVIALIKERPVSLIIFDADMPEPDIVKTMETLRREEKKLRRSEVPVLALTGHEAQSKRMLKAGATHTLCKPFTKEGLRDAVILAVPALAELLSEQDGDLPATSGDDPGAHEVSDSPSAVQSGSDGSGTPGPADYNTHPDLDPFVAFIRYGYKKRNPATHYAGDRPATGISSAAFSAGEADETTHQASFAEEADDAASPVSSGEPNVSDSPAAPGAHQEQNSPPSPSDNPPHAASPRHLQDVDLLEAALRDAPAQQGKPVLVSLPPVHEASEPAKPDTPAAPIVLSLSEEDVTPYTENIGVETPLLDLILTGDEPDEPQANTATGTHETAEPAVSATADAAESTEDASTETADVPQTAPPVTPAPPEDVPTPHSEGTGQAAPPATDTAEPVKSTPTVTTETTPPGGPGDEAPAQPKKPSAPRFRVVVSKVSSADRTRKTQESASPSQPGEGLREQNVKTDAAPPTPAAPAVQTDGSQTEAATLTVSAPDPEAGRKPSVTVSASPRPVTGDAAGSGDRLDPSPAGQNRTDAHPSDGDSPSAERGKKTETDADAAPFSPVEEIESDSLEETGAPVTAEPSVEAGGNQPHNEDPGEAPVVPAITSGGEEAVQTAPAADSALPDPGNEADTQSQLFVLPGMDGEAVEVTLLPLVPGLIHSLNDALGDTRQGRDDGKTILVQEAAGRLASRAEVFGLNKLSKIGRCVERAAEADDMEAVTTLIEDLEIITGRYVEALQECFQSFLSVDR